ncbi:WhiB family transcriptional regulator [Planobispora takensis]|uniref:Transcriptional regulator WhiB n=1 Tax=Planobispora takensis TaxID=1367882 RepID=A0A8J3T1A8_9ACTN|nr:hypothetical protein Pta02_51030 [Planobispora takensis]
MNLWRIRARCADTELDPELFFPDRGDAASATAATAICVSCPVRFECLTDALVRKERHGVWGGLAEQERTALTRLPHRCRHCRGPAFNPRSPYCSRACQLAAARYRRAARRRQNASHAA